MLKLQFKHQKFQADAAKAVVDVFAGQPYLTPTYLMDRGTGYQQSITDEEDFTGAGKSDQAFRQAGRALQPDHRDGDGRRKDVHLHQDHVRAEQALRLEQVYRGRTEHRHPRGRV